jgi:hypothetical protein
MVLLFMLEYNFISLAQDLKTLSSTSWSTPVKIFNDRVQEVLPDLTIVIRQFSFDTSKEGEITPCQVEAASRIQQEFGS